MARSSFIAAGLSSLIMSATAITPRSSEPRQNSSGVFPALESSSEILRILSGTATVSDINLKLPPAISVPASFAVRPFPGSARKPTISFASSSRFSASAIIAFASGCSLRLSSE